MFENKINIKDILLRNTRSGLLCKFIEAITVFITVPIILKSLGAENYGLWITIGQALVFFGALDFGITNSIGRFVAKYKGRNEKQNITKVIFNALVLLVAFAIIILGTLPIIIFNIDLIFNIDHHQQSIAQKLVLILGISISIDFVLRIGRGVLSGFHRFDILYNSKLIGQLFKLSSILFFYQFNNSNNIVLLGLISMITMIIPDLIMLIVSITKIFPLRGINLELLSKYHAKELLSLGTAKVVSGSIKALSLSGTLVIIANYISLEAVAIFSIPHGITMYPSMFISTFLISLTTIGSELNESGHFRRLREINLLAMKYSFAMNTGIILGVIFFGHSFLQLWLGKSFNHDDLNKMYIVFVIMMIGFVVGQINNSSGRILSGIGKHWIVSIISLFGSTLGIILSFILLKYSTLGIIGISIGWLIISFINSFIIFPIICKKNKVYTYIEMIKNILPVILYIMFPLIILNYFMSQLLINTWIELIVASLLSGTLVLILSYIFILEKRHKNNLIRLKN